jgi:hypothetical protein
MPLQHTGVMLVNEQDIRINWFKIIFSEPCFQIAAKLLESGATSQTSEHIGVYRLPPSDKSEPFIHHLIALNGQKPVEINLRCHHESETEQFYENRTVSIQTNKHLTAKLISLSLISTLTNNGYSTITTFMGNAFYDPNDVYQFSDFVHGVRIYTVDPFFLHTHNSFGLRVNTSFKLIFDTAFDNPLISRLFADDPIAYSTGGTLRKGKVVSIRDSSAMIEGKNGMTETIPLQDIFPVPSIDILAKYHDMLNLSYDFAKQVLIQSNSITKFGKDNAFIYSDTLHLIETFLVRNAPSLLRVKLPVITDTHFSVDTNLCLCKYHTLPPRIYEFGRGGQNRDFSQYQGIQKFGAIKPSKTKNPFFVVVFQESDKDLANKLYLSLKNGIGYFPGIKKFFNIELSKDDLLGIRIDLSGIPTANYSRIAEEYTKALIEKIPDLPKDRDIFAYLIIPKTPYYIDPSPYYSCKAVLTSKGIHSQAVDRTLLSNEENFKWAIANIALATFTKLGGYPWRVNTSEKTDLIMGVGRSDIYDPQRRFESRVVGYTICFAPDGTFRSFHATPPTPQTEYLSGLKSAVEHSLRLQIQKDPSIKRIIIHFPKRSGRNEINAIEEGIKTIFSDAILPYIVLRIIPESDFQGFDVTHNSKTPLEGTYIALSDKDALIWLEGRPYNRTLSKKPSNPIRISLEKTNIPRNQIDFNSLVKDVYNLAGANWRGFNAKAKPITIYYSKLIAELMYHIYKYSDNPNVNNLSVDDESPWFL